MDEMRHTIAELEAFRTKALLEANMERHHDGTQTEIKEFEDQEMQTEVIVDIKAKKLQMLERFTAGFKIKAEELEKNKALSEVEKQKSLME